MEFSTYLERIRSSFPSVIPNRAEVVNEGMQFAVVIADNWVFRFARNEWGIASLAQEARVLAAVRSRVELQIPYFEHLEPDFCAYRFVPGEALTVQHWQGLSSSAQARTMQQLGAFMRALHTTPTNGLGLSASDAVRTRQDWVAFHADLELELFPKLLRFQRAWVNALFAPVLEDRLSFAHVPALVDGDISVYHLLFDPVTGRLTGKIDFGIAGMGDPAVDLACVLGSYGERGTQYVLEAYPEGAAFLERARFWAGTFELQWAYWGAKRNPEELLFAHLGRARDLRLPA